MTLKELIFNEVRANHIKSVDYTDEQLEKIIFRTSNGLRLSLGGFMVIKKIFTAYSFEIPIMLKSRHRIALHGIAYPYFLTSRRLVFFSEGDAMIVTLAGGIEKFLENCHLNRSIV